MLDAQEPRPATFDDVRRRWTTCPPNQLESLVQAAVLNGTAIDATVQRNAPHLLLDASVERIHQSRQNPENGGRTLQEAIVLDETQTSTTVPRVASALQPPVLLQPREESKKVVVGSKPTPSMVLVSKYTQKSDEAAVRVRQFLDLRDKFRSDDLQICSIKRSIAFQEKCLEDFGKQRSNILSGTTEMDADSKIAVLDEVKEGEQNSDRVIAQLKRQLESMEPVHGEDSSRLVHAKSVAQLSFNNAKAVRRAYRDPICTLGAGLESRSIMGNRVLFNLVASRTGMDRFRGTNLPRSMGRIRSLGSSLESRRALVMNRLSHTVTINTHLAYPVYCLRFDRTGRYFITGADDYLVKVFCLADYVKAGRDIDPESYSKGAVLVCTLRGHAGVINDIDVSSDNSFIATASEDGDCRIWGLKDGCPVAILRGHTGGANMVR
jgi:hypothetical protein